MSSLRRALLLAALAAPLACRDPGPGPSRRVDASRPSLVESSSSLLPVRGTTESDRLIARLQDRVRARPTRVSGWCELATAFVRKARESADSSFYVQASDAVDRALRLDPNDVSALQLRGLILLQDHRFTEVRDLARRLVQRHAEDAVLFGLLGDAEMELGNYSAAEAAYQRMVDLRPNLMSYSRASWMRWLLGDADGAVDVGRHAVEAGSLRAREELAWTQVQLGNLYFATGDLAHALEQHVHALTVFPGYAYALVGRGRVAEARGDLRAAVEDFTAAVRANESTEHLMALGNALAAAGRSAEAAEVYARLERAGRRSDPRTLALFYADQDREHEAAVDLARRELARRGEEIYTQDVLAWALYRAGRIPEAREYSNRALRLGTLEARFHYHAGLIALAAGDRTAAARSLSQALSLNAHFDLAGARDARRVLATLVPDAGTRAPPPTP